MSVMGGFPLVAFGASIFPIGERKGANAPCATGPPGMGNMSNHGCSRARSRTDRHRRCLWRTYCWRLFSESDEVRLIEPVNRALRDAAVSEDHIRPGRNTRRFPKEDKEDRSIEAGNIDN